MMPIKYVRRLLASTFVFVVLPDPSGAMRLAAISVAPGLHLQAGASLGKFHVPPEKMGGLCLTMVSPNYPRAAGDLQTESTVVVQVVISRTGTVSPIRVVSGSPVFDAEAMNAVRLWRYRPFVREDEAIDVTTEIQVSFKPGAPGGIVTHPNK